MYDAKTFNTSRSFRFWHKGAEVWGESAYHSVIIYIGAMMIISIALLSSLFTLLAGPAIGGVILVLYWKGTTKKDTFKANLMSGAWESSNDAFWKPLSDFLQTK